jgi:NADPH:quinone reductase-like Zn-dependent oxidoreductase
MEANEIWIKKNGGPKSLILENKSSTTKLSSHEIRIDVHFSGVNFADIMMRLGLYKDAPPKPFVPGYEVSGVVSEVGASVTRFQVGDLVCAGTIFGGYKSQIILPEHLALPKPSHLSLEEAAALPVAFITAHAALIDMGRIRAQDKVLIDCATGGLGTLMLQMLKNLGANTIGLTTSPEKKALIESFGAKAMTHEEFWASSENRFDFILNSQGGSSVKRHYERLAPTGRVVCIGASSMISDGKRDFIKLIKTVLSMPKFHLISMFDKNRGVFALNALKLMEDEIYLKKMLQNFSLAEKMNIKPHIGKIISYKEAHLAHELIEKRKTTGKVLLSWN